MSRPSEAFRRQLRQIRKARGWTQQDLANALAEAGMGRLDVFVINRMESGKRRVSLDEAIGIAAVLGVSPLHLIVPRDDARVHLTPQEAVTAADARVWLRGMRPLRKADERLFYYWTPESETGWFPPVPGPWRSERPEVYKAARHRWERDAFREASEMSLPGGLAGHESDLDAEDSVVRRPNTEEQDQEEDDR
jgi:transcriptional regulator with XRE-family HTH domain